MTYYGGSRANHASAAENASGLSVRRCKASDRRLGPLGDSDLKPQNARDHVVGLGMHSPHPGDLPVL